MKKYLCLILLIQALAFGIEKKTPSGGTVKDKPGKSQQVAVGTVLRSIIPYASRVSINSGSNNFVTVTKIDLPEGRWICSGAQTQYSGCNDVFWMISGICYGTTGGSACDPSEDSGAVTRMSAPNHSQSTNYWFLSNDGSVSQAIGTYPEAILSTPTAAKSVYLRANMRATGGPTCYANGSLICYKIADN